MESEITTTIGYHFSDLEDSQNERTKLHNLIDILVIAATRKVLERV